MKSITTQNISEFEASLDNNVVFVDFWATWCAPCNQLMPMLEIISNDEQYSESNGFKFLSINSDDVPQLFQRFNIRSVPTVLIFKNGVEVSRIVGIESSDTYRKHLDLNK